ncbi:hypothetical protein AWZ03_013285 [Drosophila navojoa]|uniref:Uncharacterized protein n=1 Tax=Drosophila navojoa TaxID=7232 RepID=A0A484AV89_DRONA|nr:hypothetical protein AWZ03_013285 [Drosophila navojoa]
MSDTTQPVDPERGMKVERHTATTTATATATATWLQGSRALCCAKHGHEQGVAQFACHETLPAPPTTTTSTTRAAKNSEPAACRARAWHELAPLVGHDKGNAQICQRR